MRKYFILFCLFNFISFSIKAQTSADTAIYINGKYPETTQGVRFSGKQIIIPAALITVGGIIALEKNLDKDLKNNISQTDKDIFLDNIFPAVAPASVYILNWCNVPGKHNFIDRSVIFGTAGIMTLGSVYLLKHTISRERPDESGDDSFPSMHTAVAFMGAEFLRQEYGDQSIWYSIAGYGLAAGTGFLRMYNNKHWFSDVLVGAGIGILGTKAAYWLYPEIRKLYAGTKLDRAYIMPYASHKMVGLSFSMSF